MYWQVVAVLAVATLLLVLSMMPDIKTISRPVRPPTLSFKPDGSFKIIFLTDLHMGESEYADNATLQVGSI